MATVMAPTLASKAARGARIARPSTLRSLSYELRWRSSAEAVSQLPATWTPDPKRLAETTVTWPEHYLWPPQEIRVDPLRIGLGAYLRVDRGDVRELAARQFDDVVPFRVRIDDRSFSIAVDYGDDVNLHPELLDCFDLVFKMQYLVEGYGSDRVVPGGYIPGSLALPRYLAPVRAQRDGSRPKADAYCRFGKDKSIKARDRAVELLSAQQLFRFRGGFGRVRYVASLIDAAHTRVCVDMPGLGPLCFRLVDYLAIGSAIVSPPNRCRLHVPLEPDRHIVYCRDDLTDLVDVVDSLRRDEARLARLNVESRSYFDRYLDRRQLAGYYLATCLERL
jgi:hypothetical protein